MPVRNFSSDLLEQVPGKVAALEMTGVRWSDRGRTEWITECLRQIGKVPMFPVEMQGVA